MLPLFIGPWEFILPIFISVAVIVGLFINSSVRRKKYNKALMDLYNNTENQESSNNWRINNGTNYIYLFKSTITGITHNNEDGTDRQKVISSCSEGEIVKLIPEPNNQYDKNAIAVYRYTGQQIGYIPKGEKQYTLCNRLKSKTNLSAMISSIYQFESTNGKIMSGIEITIQEEAKN